MVKGKKFEEQATKFMRGKPIGGPGEPDYVRGSVQGEVKDWDKRMGRSAVKAEAQKGRDEIVSREGFTPEAIDYRDKFRPKIKLIDWTTKRPV